MISGVLLMVAVISGIVCGDTPRPSGARAAFKDAGQAERHLLAALGMKRRPVVDKSKVEIPAAMLELYRMQMSDDDDDGGGGGFDVAGLPLPGRHVKTANTARTYLHRGESDLCKSYTHILILHSCPPYFPYSPLSSCTLCIASHRHTTFGTYILRSDNPTEFHIVGGSRPVVVVTRRSQIARRQGDACRDVVLSHTNLSRSQNQHFDDKSLSTIVVRFVKKKTF